MLEKEFRVFDLKVTVVQYYYENEIGTTRSKYQLLYVYVIVRYDFFILVGLFNGSLMFEWNFQLKPWFYIYILMSPSCRVSSYVLLKYFYC